LHKDEQPEVGKIAPKQLDFIPGCRSLLPIAITFVEFTIVKQENLANSKVSRRQPCWLKMDFDMK